MDHNAYDLKYLSSADISHNPALGSGQLQVRDIHYVTLERRNVWEFCQLLDQKCISSRKVMKAGMGMPSKMGGLKHDHRRRSLG